MRSFKRKFTGIIFVSLLSGCIMVPKQYLEPIKKYKVSKAKTVKVEGFEFSQLQTTGYTTNTNFGTASAANNRGYSVNGSYSGVGLTANHQYVSNSAAEDFRGILLQTGCFRVVNSEAKSDLVLVGKIEAGRDMSWHYPAQFLEGLTLTPLLGMPVPARVSGETSVAIYQSDNGELLTSLKTPRIYLSLWTTLYSSERDGNEALSNLRGMIMRDLAENVSKNFCAE